MSASSTAMPVRFNSNFIPNFSYEFIKSNFQVPLPASVPANLIANSENSKSAPVSASSSNPSAPVSLPMPTPPMIGPDIMRLLAASTSAGIPASGFPPHLTPNPDQLRNFPHGVPPPPFGLFPPGMIPPPGMNPMDMSHLGAAQAPLPGYFFDPTFGPTYYDRFGNPIGFDGTRRKNATRETTAALKAWLYEHRKNPYPTKGEKIMLAIITKMTLTQVRGLINFLGYGNF